MKKNILFFVISFCTTASALAGRAGIVAPNYVVVSDEFNGAIPKGKCLVVGHVYSRYSDENGKNLPIVNGNVATLDREKSYFTDLEGQYKLVLDIDDSSIFFYDPFWEEIVIWSYDFKSQHVVTIDFYPRENEIILEVAKPVVYLYSDKKVDAEIQFSCKGDLTFTYPEYTDGWKVSVEENVITEKKSNKTFSYLFWEAETKHLDFVMTLDENEILQLPGFVIRTDTVVNFLEKSLTALGLNSTEQTDFITFWAPRMIQKEYAFVQFLVDDWYTQYVSEMTINPQPDALRRIYMMFKPLDRTEINIGAIPQELNSFERNGFTVVEWGGSEMKMSNLIP